MEILRRRSAEIADLLAGHGLSAAAAIVVAELFYKFHSFVLESLAFLATWYAVDLVLQRPSRAIWARVRAGMGQRALRGGGTST